MRRNAAVIARVAMDAVTIPLALAVATAIQPGPGQGSRQPSPEAVVAVVLAWITSIALAGGYSRYATDEPNEEYKAVVTGSALGVTLMVTGAFLVRYDLSRAWTLALLVAGVGLVFVGRGILVYMRRVHGERGGIVHRVLIVGIDDTAKQLAEDAIDALAARGPTKVVGFVAHRASDLTRPRRRDDDVPEPAVDVIVGTVEELPKLVDKFSVTEVLIAPSATVGHGFEEVVTALDGVPVELRAAPAILGFLPSRIEVHPLGNRPMLHLERPELRPWAKVIKRAVDLTFGIPLLILALPVIGACALAIRLDSPGPVFFRQARAGLRGKVFRCWKLRTMVPDAEARRAEIVQMTEGQALRIHEMGDPRITRVGRFLRRASLDELPQLFNVVAGQMSLVGPRPHALVEVEDYTDAQLRRLHVKPGMTGLWQVSGRHEHDIEDYITQDILYVQNWSVAMDIAILLRTIPAVLTMRGAK